MARGMAAVAESTAIGLGDRSMHRQCIQALAEIRVTARAERLLGCSQERHHVAGMRLMANAAIAFGGGKVR